MKIQIQYLEAELTEEIIKEQKLKSLSEWLDNFGKDGWELCCHIPRSYNYYDSTCGKYIFKKDITRIKL